MRSSIKSALTAGTVFLLLIGVGPVLGTPYFLIDSEIEWRDALSGGGGAGMVKSMVPPEWSDYMSQWTMFLVEGEPYPSSPFIPPILPQGELYVYGGGGGGGADPEDAGLVMAWGPQSPGEYASAWKFEYGLDPDLTNTIITVTVTAPQWGITGQVNNVSFGIQDAVGAIRSWQWQCGPGKPIPWNTPTTIMINPMVASVAARTPVASGFMNNPVFNIVQSMQFIVDENATWVGGPLPVPPPGAVIPAGLWNYWHNIVVTPKIQQKPPLVTKWSQPPVLWDGPSHNPPPVFYGWDEVSMYNFGPPIVADDWRCTDQRPVTDIHWWGSFLGWTQPDPPQMPDAFHIGIWKDVPAGIDERFSHPGELIWENYCTSFTWNFAGYDYDPRMQIDNEACFQFNQYLNPEEYFYQEPGPEGNIYWISISAIYKEVAPPYPWGWKTRPHFFQDDAVRIWAVSDPTGAGGWPPALNWSWAQGQPIEYPEGESWDLAFELSTTEGEVGACCYTDLTGIMLCQVTDQITCEQQLLGSWKGVGTDCTDADGNGVADICEEQPKHELGDAPDSTNSFGFAMTAYPPGGPPGVQANYPTVFAAGSPPYGPIHWQPTAVAFLGNAVTLENEADIGPDQDPVNNIIPPTDNPDKDGADDGLLLPLVFPHCYPAQFNYIVTVTGLTTAPLYVNAWCDWNRDGDWDDIMPCPNGTADEWAVQNQMLTIAGPGIYTFTTPPFLPWHPVGAPGDRLPLWLRITLSEQPWQPGAGIVGWGGSGPAAGYQFGETEDYYVAPEIPEPPKAIAWRSVRNHTGLGPLAIVLNPLATDGSVTSECRLGGIQLIEVDFDQAVVLTNPAGITVTDWPGGFSYSPTSVTLVDADTIAIGFAAGLLPDMNCYRIDLDTCVQSSLAGLPLAGDVDCWVRALIGDVNSNGSVNSIDMGAVKANIGQNPALPGKARYDVNLNGAINPIDMGAVKRFIPNAAACPP